MEIFRICISGADGGWGIKKTSLYGPVSLFAPQQFPDEI
jgi:hypothetical protein